MKFRFSYLIFASSLLPLHAQTIQHEMIIFVHGTLRPVEYSFNSLVSIMRNKIDDTLYSKSSKILRKDPYFFQGQPIQGLGLKTIDASSPSASRCIVELYETQFNFFNNPSQRLYYTFGWDGLLNTRKRYLAAKEFHNDLSQELEKLKMENINPIITVIAYSHGANVVLNLAAVQEDDPTLNLHEFTIHNLVMLGAPIQKITDYLIANPIFENVFNVYSTEDNVQGLDIFAPKQFFSKRHFSDRARFKVPEKLTQIRFRTIKKIRHLHKLKKQPDVPYEILQHNGLKFIHKDPGHIELWNFKWGAYWYREVFPLNPFPVVAFVPSMLESIKNHTPTRKNVIFDYSIQYAGALLGRPGKKRKLCVPILDVPTTSELYTVAQNFTPQNFSVKEQQKRMQDVLNSIRTQRKSKNRSQKNKLAMSRRHKKRLNVRPQSQKVLHAHLLST